MEGLCLSTKGQKYLVLFGKGKNDIFTHPMNFFKRLFKRTEKAATVVCPRCLGKGRVDAEDIKRLGQQLRWAPGRCAYCNGVGRVAEDLIGRVAVNEPYLTTSLSPGERLRLFNRDAAALERSQEDTVK